MSYALIDNVRLKTFGSRTAVAASGGSTIPLTYAYVGSQETLYFRLPVDKSVTVDWGDGTDPMTVDGQGNDTWSSTSSLYSSNDTYNISITGDTSTLTYISHTNFRPLGGDIAVFTASSEFLYINLNNCDLAGNINDLEILPKLLTLSIEGTDIGGDASGLGNITTLETINISSNPGISGSISSWSNCTNLRAVYAMFGSQINGDISSWSSLSDIITLRLEESNVSGDISGWDMPNATNIRFYQTNVEGNISSWGDKMTSLTDLLGSFCNLTGDVSNLSKITSMQEFWISDNSVTASADDFALGWPNAYRMSLRNIELSGSIDLWSGSDSLNWFYANNTLLDGDIGSLSGVSSLLYVDLANTFVSGNLADLSTMANLDNIEVDGTDVGFFGIPTWSNQADSNQNFNAYDCNWSSTEVDDCLISLANFPVESFDINIAGNNAARTVASDDAYDILTGSNESVTVNT